MNALMESLVLLQDKDSKIAELTLNLKRVPLQKQHILQQLAHRKEQALSVKKLVQNTEVSIKKIELDIGTRQTSIARLKTQQFETRKNEEFKAMGEEIQRYEEEIEGLELQELELMDELESHKQSFNKAKDAFQVLQGQIQEQIDTLDKRADLLTKKISVLKAERATFVQPIPENVITSYERLLKSKGFPVVVELDESDHCGGCHSKVIPSTKNAVFEGKNVVYCEQCGRLLY